MDIPEKVQLKRDLWTNSIPNLEKFMMRRSLIFQQMVNDGLFIFQHQDTGIMTLLVFIFSEKMGIDSLKFVIAFCERMEIKNIIMSVNPRKAKDQGYEVQESKYEIASTEVNRIVTPIY